jgi:hypothetical protein
MISSNALPTKNALIQIPDDKGISLLQSRIVSHGVKVNLSHPQLGGDLA